MLWRNKKRFSKIYTRPVSFHFPMQTKKVYFNPYMVKCIIDWVHVHDLPLLQLYVYNTAHARAISEAVGKVCIICAETTQYSTIYARHYWWDNPCTISMWSQHTLSYA